LPAGVGLSESAASPLLRCSVDIELADRRDTAMIFASQLRRQALWPRLLRRHLHGGKKQVSFRGDDYRMSILSSVDGLAFEAAYRERTHAPEGRVVIPVASRRHLAFIKRVAASVDPSRREKESSDIAFLESHDTV